LGSNLSPFTFNWRAIPIRGMSLSPNQSYVHLITSLRQIALLQSTGSVLGWDERTNLPSKGAPHRADQISLLARMAHEQFTSPLINELLDAVAGSDMALDPLSDAAVNIRETRRSYDRARKLPSSLVQAISHTASMAESAWVDARKQSNYRSFEPWLQKMLKLKQEEAACLGHTGNPYDALLDEFEPGETAAQIRAVFDDLRPRLVGLIQRVAGSSRRAPVEVLAGHYPRYRQEQLSSAAAAAIGFDFSAGRIDVSAHPFCTELGPGDTRITTRYDESDFTGSFFGVMHETGHALYNQGLPPEHWGTPRGSYISLGIHESQSRLWENLVGRTRSFWRFFLLKSQQTFPSLAKVNEDEFAFAINEIRPSLIRTESDEATYNLHIMLRFDLEQAMLRGDLSAHDLPDAWNERMKRDLGVSPPNDAQGCLQDIHWAGGAIGYFPTYTLGNIYASQLFRQAGKELGDLPAMFAAGEFAPLLNWLRRNIHAKGQIYTARQLISDLTGDSLSAAPLMEHLGQKASNYYGV
jgi:carboxypeptidase Taq